VPAVKKKKKKVDDIRNHPLFSLVFHPQQKEIICHHLLVPVLYLGISFPSQSGNHRLEGLKMALGEPW
jgi:hypothetical protein